MQQTARKWLFPLNIQLFAEGGEGDNGQGGTDENPPKQKYSDEDYLKLKASFDKTSTEIAELKKQLKNKQTDEEKKAEEEATRQKEVDDLKREVATYKIQNSLQEGFEKEEVEKISKAILDGDVDSLVKTLVDSRKAYKEKIYAEAKEEFSKSAKIPGGNGDSGDDNDNAVVQAYLKGKQKKSSVSAREKFGLGGNLPKDNK